jgi:heat shock protein HtpX
MFIVNPLTGKNLQGLFSTHPPIDDRIKRLEKMAGVFNKSNQETPKVIY